MIGFHVGMPLPKEIKYPKGQLAQWMDYNESGFVLFIGFPQMTKEELEILQSGYFSIGLLELDDFASLQFRFGNPKISNKTMPFMDLAYHPNFLNEINAQFDLDNSASIEANPNIGLTFSIILFDSATGIVKGLSMYSLGNKFSVEFCRCMERLYRNPILPKQFVEKVRALQARYNSKQLYSMSKYRHVHRGKETQS